MNVAGGQLKSRGALWVRGKEDGAEEASPKEEMVIGRWLHAVEDRMYSAKPVWVLCEVAGWVVLEQILGKGPLLAVHKEDWGEMDQAMPSPAVVHLEKTPEGKGPEPVLIQEKRGNKVSAFARAYRAKDVVRAGEHGPMTDTWLYGYAAAAPSR